MLPSCPSAPLFRVALLVLVSLAPLPGAARLPDEYAPIRVVPSPGASERRFDLRPAIEQARAGTKPMLVYFGAHDCPPCRVMEKSFSEHAARLAPKITARYQLVEIEGYLRGPRKVFVLPDGDYSLDALRRRFGDTSARFVWPSWFMLGRGLEPLQSLPPGNSEYLDPDWVELRLGL